MCVIFKSDDHRKLIIRGLSHSQPQLRRFKYPSIWYRVVWYAAAETSEQLAVPVFWIVRDKSAGSRNEIRNYTKFCHSWLFLGHLNPEKRSDKLLWNVGGYLPNDTGSKRTELDSAAFITRVKRQYISYNFSCSSNNIHSDNM